MAKKNIEIDIPDGGTKTISAEVISDLLAVHPVYVAGKKSYGKKRYAITHLPSGKTLGTGLSPKYNAVDCAKALIAEFRAILKLEADEFLDAHRALEDNRRARFDSLRVGQLEAESPRPPVFDLPLGDDVDLMDLYDRLHGPVTSRWRSTLQGALKDPALAVVEGVPRLFDRRLLAVACYHFHKLGHSFAEISFDLPAPPPKPKTEMNYSERRAHEAQRAFLRLDAGDTICRIVTTRTD